MLRSDADAPKPPAYPFILSIFKELSFRQKTCDPPIPWRIPSRLAFRFSERLLRLTVASVRHRHVSASVRRYLRRRAGSRKREKCDRAKIFEETRKQRKILGLAQDWPQVGPGRRKFVTPTGAFRLSFAQTQAGTRTWPVLRGRSRRPSKIRASAA